MVLGFDDCMLGALMSGKKIALVIICFCLVATAFGVWSGLSEPFRSPNQAAYFVGEAVGRGIFVFLLSGIIPTIVWAFFRFRTEKALAPLVTWAVLGMIFMLGGEVARRNNRDVQLDEITQTSSTAHTDAIRGFKDGCVSSQQRNAPNRTAVMNQKIEKFCDCYANRLVGMVTSEEMRETAATGKIPASIQTKIAQILPPCRQLAMP
jgi:hypothetical protein